MRPITTGSGKFNISKLVRTLAWTSAVLASLLVFPSAVPWMIACWLLVYGVGVWQQRPAWVALAVCLATLLVKGIHWTPGLILWSVGSLVVLAWHIARRRSAAPRRGAWAPVAGLWLAWAVMLIDWQHGVHAGGDFIVDDQRPVACLGDSLTACGYPRQLGKLLAVPVVDFGEDGITTADGVTRLPALLAQQPQVVVIELGGHDFLKGRSRSETKANLERMVVACRSAGAEVVLMEIPRGFMFDRYWGLERQIAREHDLELLADTAIRKLVLFSPAAPPGLWLGRAWHLSDDGLHPNRRGNQALAACVADALKRLYGPDIGAYSR